MPYELQQYFYSSQKEIAVSIAVFVIGCLLFFKWIRGVLNPGVLPAFKHFFFGVLFGLVSPAIALMLAWACGDARPSIDSASYLQSPVLNLDWGWLALLLITAAVHEEILMRGIFLVVPFGAATAIIEFASRKFRGRPPGFFCTARNSAFVILLCFQAAYFGYAHINNPAITPLSIVNIGIAGLMFGLMVYFSGSFYTAVGAHFAWNYSYVIFDLPVSGYRFSPFSRLIPFELKDGGIIGGGSFGLEGGLAMTFVLIAATIAIPFAASRRKKLFEYINHGSIQKSG